MCSSLHCTGKHLQVSMKHFTCLLCVHCVHANNNLLIRKLNNKTKLNKWSETIGTYIRCDNPITDFIWKYTLFYMHLPVNICKVVFVDKNRYSKKKANFMYRIMFTSHLHEKRLLNLGAGQ